MKWKLTTFKMLLTTTTCLAAPSFENERIELKPVENPDQFKYISVGANVAIFPSPDVSVGQRRFNGPHCLDYGISYFSYAGLMVKGNYLHYFASQSDKHLYLGVGTKIGGILPDVFFVAPSLILGFNWEKVKHHFFQIDTQLPAYLSDRQGAPWIFPLITFSYGVGF